MDTIKIQGGKLDGKEATILSHAMFKHREKHLDYQFRKQGHRFYSKPGKEQYTWEWFAVPYKEGASNMDRPNTSNAVKRLGLEMFHESVGVSVDTRIDQNFQEIDDFVERSYAGDDLDWIADHLMKESEDAEEPPEINPSKPQKVDNEEKDANGKRRKKLYIAFIEWAKSHNPKNTFGSIFDPDAFSKTYPFIPREMRYFYRLANPMLCVLPGALTFFAAAELRKLNAKNTELNAKMIFAATKEDLRVFNISDKKIYQAKFSNTGAIELGEVLGATFDNYIQSMVGQGNILGGPIEESAVPFEEGFGDVMKSIGGALSKAANWLWSMLNAKKTLRNIQKFDEPQIRRAVAPPVLPGTSIPLTVIKGDQVVAGKPSISTQQPTQSPSQPPLPTPPNTQKVESYTYESSDGPEMLTKKEMKEFIRKARSMTTVPIYFGKGDEFGDGASMVGIPPQILPDGEVISWKTLNETIKGVAGGSKETKKSLEKLAKKDLGEVGRSNNVPVVIIPIKSFEKHERNYRSITNTLLHEIGHAITYHQITEADFDLYLAQVAIMSTILNVLHTGDDKIDDQYNAIAHVKCYWMTKIEKMANDQFNITPEQMAFDTYGRLPNEKLTQYVKFEEILQLNISASMIKSVKRSKSKKAAKELIGVLNRIIINDQIRVAVDEKMLAEHFWESINNLKDSDDPRVASFFEQSEEDYIIYESVDLFLEKTKKEEIPLTPAEREEIKQRFGDKPGVAFKHHKGGYFCHTHRCRSNYYPSISDIPKSKVKFVASTG